MSKTICLYIFDNDVLSIKRFDNIEVSQESLNRVLNDPEAEVMTVFADYSPNNYILKDNLNIRTLWISRNEGEVIITSKRNLWLCEPNNALAIQTFLEYEIMSLGNAIEAYNKSIRKISSQFEYLKRQLEGSTHVEEYSSITKADTLPPGLSVNEMRRVINEPRV